MMGDMVAGQAAHRRAGSRGNTAAAITSDTKCKTPFKITGFSLRYLPTVLLNLIILRLFNLWLDDTSPPVRPSVPFVDRPYSSSSSPSSSSSTSMLSATVTPKLGSWSTPM